MVEYSSGLLSNTTLETEVSICTSQFTTNLQSEQPFTACMYVKQVVS